MAIIQICLMENDLNGRSINILMNIESTLTERRNDEEDIIWQCILHLVLDVSAAAESALHSQRRVILPYLLCGEIPSPTGKKTSLRLLPREKQGRAHQDREGILLLVLRLHRRNHQALHHEQEANQEAHAVRRSRKGKRIMPKRSVVRCLSGTLLQLGMDNLPAVMGGRRHCLRTALSSPGEQGIRQALPLSPQPSWSPVYSDGRIHP